MVECNTYKIGVSHLCVVGNDLLIIGWHRILQLSLPFCTTSKNGDFFYYKPIESHLPNPFTSVNQFIPKNRLESLKEFVSYPSYWSTLHHATALMDEQRVLQAFKIMNFFNLANKENAFTLAIKRNDVKIILDVM